MVKGLYLKQKKAEENIKSQNCKLLPFSLY